MSTGYRQWDQAEAEVVAQVKADPDVVAQVKADPDVVAYGALIEAALPRARAVLAGE